MGGSSLPSAIRFRNSKTISQLISKDFPVAEICSNDFSELSVWHIDHINKNRYQNFIEKYKKNIVPSTNFYNFVKKKKKMFITQVKSDYFILMLNDNCSSFQGFVGIGLKRKKVMTKSSSYM